MTLSPRSSHGSETILLVDDENAVRAAVAEVLRRSGYTVLEAGDGDEAVSKSEAYVGRIHLLVTDVALPVLSGPDIRERLSPARPEMKVVYMSGYADDVVQREIAAGGVVFMEKPFRLPVLVQRVRDVLDGL